MTFLYFYFCIKDTTRLEGEHWLFNFVKANTVVNGNGKVRKTNIISTWLSDINLYILFLYIAVYALCT
mgnify:CR=1 FL=1